MRDCTCAQSHTRRRIVLTGGPGAGKTAVLELIRQSFCVHVRVLPESAGIVFGGGFPRTERLEDRQAAQRAIFYVQRELETAAEGENRAVVLCDRGTVDGGAYWPGPDDLWASVGTTLTQQLQRYDTVIHLRTPPPDWGYNRTNPLRTESAAEAAVIDERIAQLWARHPRRFSVVATANFLTKAARVIEILRDQVPACCQPAVVPGLALPARPQELAETE